ncbi:MAG TPA: recombination mediator RecR [Anaerolineales bacterium]|nr:recombination mediator RecR [Anaerolineales bacterium]
MRPNTAQPVSTPRPVQKAIDELSRLPGIGPKSASRLAFFLLRAKQEQVEDLANALLEMRANIRFCQNCFHITTEDRDPCTICIDPARDAQILCVVEDPLDVIALEKTRLHKGKYHVLHGSISPVDGIGPEDLRIRELMGRIQREPIREVIVATNPNLSGQATAMYLHQQLQNTGVRVTRLAQGLPVGGDLEYADETTLARALEGRREMS